MESSTQTVYEIVKNNMKHNKRHKKNTMIETFNTHTFFKKIFEKDAKKSLHNCKNSWLLNFYFIFCSPLHWVKCMTTFFSFKVLNIFLMHGGSSYSDNNELQVFFFPRSFY